MELAAVKFENVPSAIVIGAGVGGITAAAQLARKGFKVTVVEKCDQPGGRCGYFEKDGHRFDTGPTLYLMPEMYSQAFASLGERVEDHLDLVRVDPTYRVHFDDGSCLNLTSDLLAMRDQLEAFELGSFEAYLHYLSEGRQNYDLAIPNFAQRNFNSAGEFFNLRNLILALRVKALKKHYSNVASYFQDQRLRQAFTFQDMYVGLNPYNAPAMFSFLQYSELVEGVWFPKFGMYSLVDALMKISSKWGVDFHFDSAVEEIEIDDDRAKGVILSDGRRLEADIIIANADLPYVYDKLLSDERESQRLDRKEYTCSTLMFFWGLGKQYPQLATNNLFFGEDYKQSFDCIIERHALPESPSFYIHAPVRADPSMAPLGQDSITAVVPVGHIDDTLQQDWPTVQKTARGFIHRRLARIGITDLEENIKFEEAFIPPDWKSRYNLVKGSTHGLSHSLFQMGYLRPRNRHKDINNLYFVGASTHPGTGLPTVLFSAKLTVERILQEISSHKNVQARSPLAVHTQ